MQYIPILEAYKEIAVIPVGCRKDIVPMGNDSGKTEEFL